MPKENTESCHDKEKLSSHYTPYTTSWNWESQLEERKTEQMHRVRKMPKPCSPWKRKMEYAVLISNGLPAPVSMRPSCTMIPIMECHNPQGTHIQHTLPLELAPLVHHPLFLSFLKASTTSFSIRTSEKVY